MARANLNPNEDCAECQGMLEVWECMTCYQGKVDEAELIRDARKEMNYDN